MTHTVAPTASRRSLARLTPALRSRVAWLSASALLLGLGALAPAACSSDSGSSGGGGSSPGGSNGISATGVFGTVKDSTGAPIAGATVSVGGTSTTTDAAGTFKTRAAAGDVVVSVRAKGFADGFARVTVSTDTASAAHLRLLRMEGPFSVDATAGGTATGSRGAKVVVPPGGLVDRAGAAVTGAVDVFVTPVDPGDPVQGRAAPELLAQSASGQVALTSFGMLDVTIEQAGERVQVAPGSSLAVSIPVPAGPTAPPSTVPLWSFDVVKGLWVSEGDLTLDTAAGVYQGSIPHMSWWNADIEEETSCVCGTVLSSAGVPVGGAQIFSSGVGYGGGTSATSGPDGNFCIATKLGAKVQITAIHADGGGQIRELDGGTVIAKLPITDPAVCAPGGTWTVEPGKVTFPDGSTTTCTQTLASIQSCVGDAFVGLYGCFDPSGSCTSSGALAGTNVTYANGAKIVSHIDTGPPTTFTSEYFASNGKSCGTQTTTVTGTGGSADPTTGAATVSIVTPTGQSSYSLTTDGKGGSTIGCLDGSSRTLTNAETSALQSCGGDEQECTQTGGGNGFGCAENDCTGTDVCCGGAICTKRESCNLGVSCKSQADCVGDEVCCITGTAKSQNICSTKNACANATGGCKADGDCDAGSLCCNGSCEAVPFCGECGASSDCKDPSTPYCCAAPGSGNMAYCATDAASCFSGATCTADAECDEAGMICCDDGSGNDKSCRTLQDCYAGKLCTSSADCNGLYCCDDPEAPFIGRCNLQNYCSLQKACTADADCGTGACCDTGTYAGYCLQDAGACFVGVECTSNAECGPDSAVTCCAVAGNRCLRDCPNP